MSVIKLAPYYTEKGNRRMYEQIIKRLNEKQGKGVPYQYSIEECIDIAKEILRNTDYYNGSYTPINRIAKDFGITPYTTTNLENNLSGVIYVGGTTKKMYHTDKVIFVNKNEPRKHQRFVIAHEIGHYLFDCLPNDKYNDSKIVFAETYFKGQQNSEKEIKADQFAAELLMPAEVFIEQYHFAKMQKNNNIFVMTYLSEFFGTKISSINKRMDEVFA